jgi:AraC-like DNA-binding protein
LPAVSATAPCRDEAYREIAPPPALRSRVECFWVARGGDAPHRVLPDGCVDFLFDANAGEAGAVLVGAMTRQVLVPAGPARDLVAVRFHPGGAHGFVAAPLAEFTDEVVAMQVADSRLRELAKLGTAALAADERVAVITTWLMRHLPAAANGRDDLDAALVALRSGRCRVDAAAAAAGCTRQHFTRTVRARTGLPPKLLARIRRLRNVLDDAHRTTAADLAGRHGFADQAHLARDARDLAGERLSALLRR